MENKEVSIGICGAIVGILIGAGSVSYAQELSSSFEANVFQGSVIAYRNSGLEEAYKQRRAQREVDLVEVEESEEVHSAAPMGEEERNACIVKVHIAEELRGILIPLVPGRPIDALVRESMNQAFDSYIADCQSVQAEVRESLKPAAKEKVEEEVQPTVVDPKHCDQFTSILRKLHCVSAAAEGIKYEAGQYYRR